jgi:hypothetical protein
MSTVPVLEVAQTPHLAAPADPATDRTRRTAGVVVGGVGVVALGFGVVSSLIARGALDDARSACPSYPDRCSSAATEPNDRAATWSSIATVSVIGGVVLTAAGCVLYLWPSSPSRAALGVTPGGST